MKKEIKEFEQVSKEGKTLVELGIEATTYYAYQYSKGTENELINYDDVIWEKDISNIVKCLRKYGIKEFTISSTFSGLIKTIAEFEKEGCKLDGIVEITNKYSELTTDENGMIRETYKKIPAFKLSIKE